MGQASIGAGGTARCIVRISIDTERIRAGFANEKPPVPDDEWNAAGYVEYREAAYRTALEDLRTGTPERPVAFEARFGETANVPAAEAGSVPAAEARSLGVPAATGDRVRLELTPPDHDADTLDACVAAASAALRAVFADTGAWRLFLLPAYFERHRAWRRAVGAPIQH